MLLTVLIEYPLALRVVQLLQVDDKQSIHSQRMVHSLWLQALHQYQAQLFFLIFYNMSIIISATFPSDEYIHILTTQK